MPVAFAGCCLGLATLACVLALTGCSANPANSIVLPAQQENPDRDPPAGAVRISVLNDSDFQASVQVECFIGETLVHHSEAVLAAILGSDPQADLSLGWEEADRVVVSAQIRDSDGAALWSDQKTYVLGTDFADLESVEYTIQYAAGGQPVAVIGGSSTATAGRGVTLDGLYSHDPDNDPLTYAWQQVSGPAVTLTNASTSIVSFTAPMVTGSTDLVLRLTVSDGQLSGSDEVAVTVQPNQAPMAVADGPGQVNTNDTVTLDGSSSYDPNDDALTYQWEQISGTPVVLSNATGATATFAAPVVSVSDTLVFRLTVKDPSQAASARQVNVVVLPGGAVAVG